MGLHRGSAGGTDIMKATASVQYGSAATLELDLRQVLDFCSWLDALARRNGGDAPAPVAPALRDPTLQRWAGTITSLDAGTRDIDARLTALERSADRQAAELRSLTVRIAEHLAALHEASGRPGRAQRLRLRAAAYEIR